MNSIQILAHFFAAPLADMQGLTLKELEWLGSGSVVLVVALTITSLIKAVRDKGRVHATLGGQPIEVRTAVEYVPAPRFANFEKYVRRRDREIAEGLHEMRLKAEERRAEAAEQSAALLEQIQERLEAHWKELNHERSANAAQLHQRIEATTLQMRQEMDAKFQIVRTELNDLPGRLISLLRDTGAMAKEAARERPEHSLTVVRSPLFVSTKVGLGSVPIQDWRMSRQAGKSFCTACEAVIDAMQDGGTNGSAFPRANGRRSSGWRNARNGCTPTKSRGRARGRIARGGKRVSGRRKSVFRITRGSLRSRPIPRRPAATRPTSCSTSSPITRTRIGSGRRCFRR